MGKKGKTNACTNATKNVQQNKNARSKQWNRGPASNKFVESPHEQEKRQRQAEKCHIEQLADQQFTQRRTVRESSRARWLKTSTTAIIGDIAGTGPRKCLPYFNGP